MSACPDVIHGGRYRWVCVMHILDVCVRKAFPINTDDN